MATTIDTGALNALLAQDAAKAARVKEVTPDWSKLLTKPGLSTTRARRMRSRTLRTGAGSWFSMSAQ